jgi:predicted transglutaminase-like cysteine proteinase
MPRFAKRALCATLLLGLIPAIAEARPLAGHGLAPAAFSTIPLAVNHTHFDARWSRVLHSGIGATAISRQASHLGGKARLQSVNTAANRAIAYREDRANGKASDYWTNAGETLARGSGDCEDYAIAKMQLLLNAGVPSSDIFMVIGNDLTLGSAHAMLVVHQGGKFWVLDSLTNEIRPSESYTDFRPVLSFGAKGAWVHGYAVGTAPRNVYAARASTSRVGVSGKLGSVIAAQRRGQSVGRVSSTGVAL